MTTFLLNVARSTSGEATLARPPKANQQPNDVSKSEFESRAVKPLTMEKVESPEIEQDGTLDRLTAESITQDLLQSLFSVDTRSPEQKIEVLLENFRQSLAPKDILVTPEVFAAQGARPNAPKLSSSETGQKLLELIKTSDLKTIQDWLSGSGVADLAHLKQAVQRIFDARTGLRGPGPSFSLARPTVNPYPGDEGMTLANSLPLHPAGSVEEALTKVDPTGAKPMGFKLAANDLASAAGVSADVFKNVSDDVVEVRYARPIVSPASVFAADVAPAPISSDSTSFVAPVPPPDGTDIDLALSQTPASDDWVPEADILVSPKAIPSMETLARPVVDAATLAPVIDPATLARPIPVKLGRPEMAANGSKPNVKSDDAPQAVQPDILVTPEVLNGARPAPTVTPTQFSTSDDGDWTEILSEDSTTLQVDPTSDRVMVERPDGVDRIMPKLDRPLTHDEAKHTVARVNETLTQLFADKKQSQITIHLRPEELGEVIVTVQRQGRQLIAEVSASQEVVKETLMKHRHDLVTTVERQGFSLSELNVRHEPTMQWNHGQQGNPQDQMGWRDEFERARNMANVVANDRMPAPATDKSYRAQRGGLDLAA